MLTCTYQQYFLSIKHQSKLHSRIQGLQNNDAMLCSPDPFPCPHTKEKSGLATRDWSPHSMNDSFVWVDNNGNPEHHMWDSHIFMGYNICLVRTYVGEGCFSLYFAICLSITQYRAFWIHSEQSHACSSQKWAVP